MNILFYLAIDRLPLATVGAIEFLGVIVLAAVGVRSRRNVIALVLAIGGVAVLTELRLSGDVWGFVFAFGNCVGFMLYISLGHRIANTASDGQRPASATSLSGIDQLGFSMLIAAVVATPIGLGSAFTAFAHPLWLLWGVGVGDLFIRGPVCPGPARDGAALEGDLCFNAGVSCRQPQP